MGKTKGPYEPEYPAGSRVRIASSPLLEEFKRTWKFHHALRDEQLAFAGEISVVVAVGFYHGGDELYTLKGIPGLWHEQCLTPV